MLCGMSIPELNKYVYGHIALYLEEVHLFAQASKACKKIVEDSFYPAFWNKYLQLPQVKPYAEKLEHLPNSAAKVRALFESLVKEVRGISADPTDPPNLPIPKLRCSLQPAKLTEFTRYIANEQNRSLVTIFQEGISELPALVRDVDPHKDDCTQAAEVLRRWIEKNPNKLSECKELDVASCCVSVFPEEIALFQSLDFLICTNNSIITFPEAATRLRSLKKLFLTQNLLFDLPAEMCELTQLEVLSVAANRFALVPDSIYTLSNLRELYLGYNGLTSISSAIGSLKKLNTLWLQKNQLTTLPAELTNLIELQDLNLEENPIKTVPRALKMSDVAAIRDNPEIKAAEEIPPTLCEQVCELFWSICSWFTASAKALLRWLCG
jgi:hypothetical protein